MNLGVFEPVRDDAVAVVTSIMLQYDLENRD